MPMTLVLACRLTSSNMFSETTGAIELISMETPFGMGIEICSNGPEHMIKMTILLINLCLLVLSAHNLCKQIGPRLVSIKHQIKPYPDPICLTLRWFF